MVGMKNMKRILLAVIAATMLMAFASCTAALFSTVDVILSFILAVSFWVPFTAALKNSSISSAIDLRKRRGWSFICCFFRLTWVSPSSKDIFSSVSVSERIGIIPVLETWINLFLDAAKVFALL